MKILDDTELSIKPFSLEVEILLCLQILKHTQRETV